MNNTLGLNQETLAHEMFHALYNRFDDATLASQQYFTFNTNPPSDYGVTPLPDVRVYRRIHADTIEWIRRRREARFPVDTGTVAGTSTGNTLVANW